MRVNVTANFTSSGVGPCRTSLEAAGASCPAVPLTTPAPDPFVLASAAEPVSGLASRTSSFDDAGCADETGCPDDAGSSRREVSPVTFLLLRRLPLPPHGVSPSCLRAPNLAAPKSKQIQRPRPARGQVLSLTRQPIALRLIPTGSAAAADRQDSLAACASCFTATSPSSIAASAPNASIAYGTFILGSRALVVPRTAVQCMYTVHRPASDVNLKFCIQPWAWL